MPDIAKAVVAKRNFFMLALLIRSSGRLERTVGGLVRPNGANSNRPEF
jgi:hypothetical protein